MYSERPFVVLLAPGRADCDGFNQHRVVPDDADVPPDPNGGERRTPVPGETALRFSDEIWVTVSVEFRWRTGWWYEVVSVPDVLVKLTGRVCGR